MMTTTISTSIKVKPDWRFLALVMIRFLARPGSLPNMQNRLAAI
jgi:hypothetical protein